ncbi:ATP-dependent DNA helicase pif1-like [Macrosteles quadrilineatus]|uniref:ATP-dependent DNA helicase pif1-like n=1 Tax=Macrosteles quadrilineatus TaxID=74068 RepID=UPI0023E15E1C|nr:ATP-dependent DNA helicase pif1-like [Macrosteles quadrilineatus]
MHEIIQNPPNSTLTAFFKLCQNDPFAKTLLYCEVPHYYTWNATRKEFRRRLLGVPVENNPGIKYSDALGRVYNIHPNNLECFCLRMLLHKVRGPTSFQDLRTVENVIYATYKEACQSLGLLEDENHWDSTMQEAALVKSAPLIRQLFAILISSCGLLNPLHLWEKYKSGMSEDILHRHRVAVPQLEVNDLIINEALKDLQQRILSICGKDLSAFGLPRPHLNLEANTEVLRERSYNPDELAQYVQEMTPKLLPEQRNVVDIVLTKIINQESAVFFLDAPGGTGKTFVMKLLLAHIRKENDIAMAVASSGIAATLLPGGRTAHSVFKLPLNLTSTESATCNISKDSERAALLRQCKLLVWDECTMSHKRALEALNRLLQDVRGNSLLMGGLVVLLAGDFRQTLPVVQKGTPADEINACLKTFILWSHVTKLHLTQNMRVHLFNDVDSGQFAHDLLTIGEGRVPSDVHQMINLPNKFCNFVSSTEDLISSVFPNIAVNYSSSDWLCERAILCPKNDAVNRINNKILTSLPGETTTFNSIDTIMDEEQAVNYPKEFLNSLELSGVPPHELCLKVGVPVMLMRNLDAPKLCNGTRLVIKSIRRNIVQATIITGYAKGEDVIIPRIPIIPTDLPFNFKRLQFPIRVAFAMSINKSQGQTMKVAGLHLENQCFSHGQLYVACSRVSSGKNLFILTSLEKVTNIVYKNVL